MTKEQLLALEGDFTWDFGQRFFIKTEKGNFVWSDPDYSGDNTIRETFETLEDFVHPNWGRDKGKHIIGEYIDDTDTLIFLRAYI